MKRWLVPILLLVIVLVSYGQTLRMYFWIDDNALIYKLQHINEPLGFWGEGAMGSGPYRHIVNQFVPFYPIFGVNPIPYYAVGLVLYFLTSLSLYWFIKNITKNLPAQAGKKIALLSAVIYASGFIGADSIFGIVNSWQTSRGIIMALFTFYLYWKFIKSKRIIFYIISAVLFYLTLDTVYIRAHGLIFVVILFDILLWPFKLKLKSILSQIARLSPFAFAHYHIYLISIAYAKEFGIFKILQEIFINGKYELIATPIQDIGNVFIPDKISNLIKNGEIVAGILVILLFVYLTIRFLKKKRKLVKLLIFSFGWSVFNFVMFYAREPLHTLWSTHRYFSFSFIGVSLFWAISFYLLIYNSSKKFSIIFKFLSICLVASFLFFSIKYQQEFNNRRSIPAKDFFHKFTSAVPKLKKGDVLYFDLANESRIAGQFGSFFGGMFSEASNFAIYTEGIDYMNDFLFTYNFSDVLSWLADGSLKLNNLYTFYYGANGLVNTTYESRNLLKDATFQDFNNTKFQNNKILIDARSVHSLIPSKLSFSLKAELIQPVLPYDGEGEYESTPEQKNKIFAYLNSKADYYSNVKVKAASFWKEQEPGFLVDQRLDTAWRGHRGYWDEYFRGREQNEILILDLGRVKNIGGLRWFTAQKPLMPSYYIISSSVDNKNWVKLSEVTRNIGLTEGSEVVDKFDSAKAQYIKMDVINTLGNDGPEIKELEVIEADYIDLERGLIDQVSMYPFARINSLLEYNSASKFIRNNAKMKIFWKSDADPNWLPTNYKEIPVTLDSNFHKYNIELPASGLVWQEFIVEGLNFPAKISISDIKLTYAKN